MRCLPLASSAVLKPAAHMPCPAGTGWPSFFDALPNAVVLEKDNSIPFMPRTEVGGWVGVWWGRWLVGTASSIEVVLGAFKYAGTVP